MAMTAAVAASEGAHMLSREPAQTLTALCVWRQDAAGTSKMSMEGWWMVHTTVRPVSTVLRTARITIAAARASRPVRHDTWH